MADQGAIGRTRVILTNTAALRATWHYTRSASLWPASWTQGMLPRVVMSHRFVPAYVDVYQSLREDGYISGNVKDTTVNQVNVVVKLFWRVPYVEIGWARTDANGNFRFDKLDTTKTYCVVMVDPAGSPVNNLARRDYVAPVAY